MSAAHRKLLRSVVLKLVLRRFAARIGSQCVHIITQELHYVDMAPTLKWPEGT